jgi:hypothetical protein
MNDKKSKIKSIVTIDAYEDRYYILKGQKFKSMNSLSFSNSNFVSAFINNSDIISTTVEISRSIPVDDDIMEIKAYEELGLDQAVEYLIRYFERESEGDMQLFDIFVIEQELLENTFTPIIKETKFIDLLIPTPMLFKAVYDREILSSSGVHCFVYFAKNDAFITFYKDGQYLYAKSIEYSLDHIYDKYCELSGDRVDEVEFFKILESEGLKTIHADYQQNLMKLFGDIFITINDIVIYAKRAFDLPTIDQMFMGSSKGTIIGLDEYSQNYLGLQSSELNFNFNLENDDWYTDQLQMMLAITAMEYMEDSDSAVNLTVFERAPVFYKRTSGQFIIATSLSILVGVSYPLVYLIGSYMNDATNMVLASNEIKLNEESERYKKILGQKKKEIGELDKVIDELAKKYHAKEKTLISIYNKKVKYSLKSELLYSFSKDIRKFKVNTNIITSEGNNFTFSLLSKDDKEITRLIKHISETHFNMINAIDIEVISREDDDKYYNGVLKVDLK